MSSVAVKSDRNLEVAVTTGHGAGAGRAGGAGAIGRAWRGLVQAMGRLPDYLVGPAPWAARTAEAAGGDGEGGDATAEALPSIPPSPEPGWPGGVEVIRLKGGRPRTLTGAR
jgi:hypothetical protein